MANNKHLTLDERTSIEVALKETSNFTMIAKSLGYKRCKSCSMCNAFCNGCGKRHSEYSLEKRLYIAKSAHDEYLETLSESRTGISFSEDEITYIDMLVSPLIKKGQSPHHVCVTNRDSIMLSERSLYRLIDSCLISARNIDLPRKVRFSVHKNPVHVKVDKSCRIGRTYDCFLAFMNEHPDFPVVQFDSVEGKKGGKVLLTIHFTKAEMMLTVSQY